MAIDKSALRVGGDLYEAFGALGAVTEVVAQFRSGYYVKSIMDYAHTVAAKEFDILMFAQAAGNPERFHHVFEPNHPGQAGFQLWRHNLVRTSSRTAQREVTWKWVPSKMPIRTPEQRRNRPYGDDPMAGVSMEQISKLSERKYIFRQRAPMMEYGFKAVVTPKYAKALFIPKWNARPSKRSSLRGFFFAKMSDQDFTNSNPQFGTSDGAGTVGNFTQAWITFWNGAGEQTLREEIERAVNDDVTNSDILRKTKRRGHGQVSLVVAPQDATTGFLMGRGVTEAHFQKKTAKRKSVAKYVAEEAWGDLPFDNGLVGYDG